MNASSPRRLLVVADLHHASPRIPGLVDLLPAMGWQATVITPPPPPDAGRVLGLPPGFATSTRIAPASHPGDVFQWLRAGLRCLGWRRSGSITEQMKSGLAGLGPTAGLIDRMMRWYQTLVAIPDTEWPWRLSALRVGRRLLRDGGFSAILSSSPCPTVHMVAASLARRTGLPWVADFRDPWSNSHNYVLPRFRQCFDRRIERRLMRGARLITTVSAGFAEKLRALHAQEVVVIRNGFRSDGADRVEAAPSSPVLTIVYTGSIYAGKQDPTRIVAAIRRLIDEGRADPGAVRLEFYGRFDHVVQSAIATHRLESVVVQRGIVPREEIRRIQRTAGLLLLLQWEDPSERGIFPLKFYEYLDAGRPILATGGEAGSEIAAILAETGAGVVAPTQDDICRQLAVHFAEHAVAGRLTYRGDRSRIQDYELTGCARRLARHLDGLAVSQVVEGMA